METMQTIQKEKLDTSKTTWDLSPLGKKDDDPDFKKKRKKIESANNSFVKKWKDRDDYLKKPKILKDALDDYESLMRQYGTSGDEGYYFHLRTAQDGNNPVLKAQEQKIHDFSMKLGNNIQFFEMRIAKISESEQKKFLTYNGLQKYKHFIECLFDEARYLRSEPEEKILNLTRKGGMENWTEMLSGFLNKEKRKVLLEDGTRKEKNLNKLWGLIESTRKPVRDDAARAINDILLKHIDTAEAEINSVLEHKKMIDELRGMKRPDTSRHLDDDIDTDVVDTLIDAVSDQFGISKRYYKLKAKLFGVSKLSYHERNVPYGKLDKKYSYEDSVALVYDVFLSLDQEFADIFKRFVEKGHIDVYPRDGKRGGAFCAGRLLTQRTYILLNHNGLLDNVTTMAHEAGHGINNELMRPKQHGLYFDVPMFTAEVASTYMEDFVLERLLEDANDELRLALMMTQLESAIGTIFRQAAFYRFEQELHKNFREKGYLSKEEIGKLFQKHTKAYMGDAVEQSPGSENWWIYVPHFRFFFYVYSYASGLLISKAMQGKTRENPEFISKVKEFLSAGTSDSPKNIFAKMGIDVSDPSFWEDGLKEVEKFLNKTKLLAKKLGKI